MNHRIIKTILSIAILFIIIYSITNIPYSESSYTKALNNNEVYRKCKLINVIDIDSNHKYAFYLTEKKEIEVVEISKNLFGWKVGGVTGNDFSLASLSNRGISGPITSTDEILYGYTRDSNITRIEVNNYTAPMFSIEEYNTRIWYITKEYIKDHNVFVVYNHNNEIIYDFSM